MSNAIFITKISILLGRLLKMISNLQLMLINNTLSVICLNIIPTYTDKKLITRLYPKKSQ